jgi:hypothetical protein
MEDLLSRIESHDLVPIVSIVLTFLAGMVVWLTLQWRLYRRTELEVLLKREMLERGMSAEEIERVMRSRLTPHGEDRSLESRQRASSSA